MTESVYTIHIRDFVDGVKIKGEFTSPRLFLMFYHAYKERLKHGESIDAFRDGKPFIVHVRPLYVQDFLSRLARNTPVV